MTITIGEELRFHMVATLDHAATSWRLMDQAESEFAAGDWLQASEKGWGAAAHAMKEIAKSRGWPNGRHAHLFTIAGRLARENGRPEINTLFQVASATHVNFYEGWLDEETLAFNLADIRRLLGILEEESLLSRR